MTDAPGMNPGVLPPNIVVFYSDDHAQWACGPYGNTVVETPTLDHLARNGVTFENAFTVTPVCSPARASFWTGRLPSQHGIHDYIADSDPQVAQVRWLDGQRTLAAELREAGYVTAMVGKWHLGPRDEENAPFDYWFEQGGAPPAPSARTAEAIALPALTTGFDRHAITDQAIAFLRSAAPGCPFFLFVGHFATHSPWANQPNRLVERYRRRTGLGVSVGASHPQGRTTGESASLARREPAEALAQYYAATHAIDEQVGRVIDELDAQDLRSRTVIVYTSDHGLNIGQHGLWGKGNSTYPYNFLEESIRVPLIIAAPEHTQWPQRRSELVSTCDVTKAIRSWAGVRSDTCPGHDLRHLCEGRRADDWPHAVMSEYGDSRMIRTHRHKLILRYGDDVDEFYDLDVDPGEQSNCVDDAQHADIIAQLRRELEAYFERWAEPAHDGRNVREQPRHNRDESWRRDGTHQLVRRSSWTARYTTGGKDE